MKLPATTILASTVLLAACATSGMSQSGPPSTTAARTGPTRMPGDMDPPSAAQTMALRLAGAPHQLPPPDTTPAVPMTVALAGAQAVVAACEAQGLRVAAGVTNADGVLMVGLTADGTSPPGRLFGGVPKAVAAIGFREPTSQLRAQLLADPSRMAAVKPNMFVLPGGLPVIDRGRLLGAIGVSGASADQDEACARAGLQAIMARLHAGPG